MTVKETERAPGSVVKLEFELPDPSVPATGVTATEGCRFTLEEVVPRGDGCYRTYYTVEGCDPDRISDLVPANETDEVRVHTYGDAEGLVEVLVTEDLPNMVLAAHGALPRRLVVEDGTTTLAVEVPPDSDPNEIIARFTEAYPDAELTVRRQQSYLTPVFRSRGFERALDERLTDRQREVLETCHERGFYEWPREATGEQLSEELDITPSTFYQHLRAAEQKLVQLVFEEGDLRGEERTAD